MEVENGALNIIERVSHLPALLPHAAVFKIGFWICELNVNLLPLPLPHSKCWHHNIQYCVWIQFKHCSNWDI